MPETNSPFPCVQELIFFKVGHHLDIGQNVLYENHRHDPSKGRKLQQRQLGPFTVTKRITSTTCQIQDDKDPSVVKTVHRNHLVEYCAKNESLPAMIEEYVPHDQQDDNFYERFLEHGIGKLNSFTEPLAEDTIPFPIRPLRTAPAITSHKRDSVSSGDSGVGSPQVFSPTLPITPEHQPQRLQETAIEQPSTSTDTRLLTPIQQFPRNSRRSTAKEPKYFKLQPHDLNSQSIFVPSLASAIISNGQQFVVAVSPTLFHTCSTTYTSTASQAQT